MIVPTMATANTQSRRTEAIEPSRPGVATGTRCLMVKAEREGGGRLPPRPRRCCPVPYYGTDPRGSRTVPTRARERLALSAS